MREKRSAGRRQTSRRALVWLLGSAAVLVLADVQVGRADETENFVTVGIVSGVSNFDFQILPLATLHKGEEVKLPYLQLTYGDHTELCVDGAKGTTWDKFTPGEMVLATFDEANVAIKIAQGDCPGFVDGP